MSSFGEGTSPKKWKHGHAALPIYEFNWLQKPQPIQQQQKKYRSATPSIP
jgi:hypothetical protein